MNIGQEKADQLGFLNDGQNLPPSNQSQKEDSNHYLVMSQDQCDRSSSDYNFKIETNEESRIQ